MNRKLAILLLYVVAAVAVLSLCAGCRTVVTGGTSHHDTGSVTVAVEPGRVTVTDSRESISTTQPSTETNTGQMPQLGGSREGELGGLTFAQAKDNAISGKGWIIAILFWIAAAVTWLVLRRPMVAVLLAALGVGAALLPVWMGAACLIIPLAALVYFAWHNNAQVVAGISNGLSALPTDLAERFKNKMAEKQDDATKRVVRAAKPL
jgi:hypothetical protein